MKAIDYILAPVVAIVLLVGCGTAPSTQTETISPSEESAADPGVATGGLDPTSALALGTLKLEGTEHAVTPAQATALLPLWQMIQGGSLQGDAETDAVLSQIEGAMTGPQLSAIEAMALTIEDQQAWMQERGIEMPAMPGGQAGPGAPQDLSEGERAKLREELQAMGSMTAEERATRMAELGIEQPQGAPEGGPGSTSGRAGRSNALLDPLVELLAERAAS
ncbi:MAG: hypothetical protein ISS56_13670 [Anaerolineae bacterium]|nr:hypothetical protein [Anaerolineae bacterium]